MIGQMLFVVFWANRIIKENEELTIFYGTDYFNRVVNGHKLMCMCDAVSGPHTPSDERLPKKKPE
ncbi:hypothetical protein QBC34DRAFT_386663 [Podospora aff. communis PSN243]|uniref:SET domain-containing protein n=1 Tax=Podospora aff. communis PSN243 TaxID=3040156 RepID=A0AAV9G3D5_9PEZI|nr:hypothetical protein QBC34DRAFT_386663 [Podospora aff. communis PSN243]